MNYTEKDAEHIKQTTSSIITRNLCEDFLALMNSNKALQVNNASYDKSCRALQEENEQQRQRLLDAQTRIVSLKKEYDNVVEYFWKLYGVQDRLCTSYDQLKLSSSKDIKLLTDALQESQDEIKRMAEKLETKTERDVYIQNVNISLGI